MPPSILLRRPYDMHCHFRTGSLLKTVLPETARYARFGLAMPNTKPQAILTAQDVASYRDEIASVLDTMNPRPNFAPLMTIEIRDTTTPAIVEEALVAGAIAGKVYPKGVTTNSENGLTDFFSPAITQTFAAMEETGMMLLLHGEIDRERLLVTKREHEFLPILRRLAASFPRLKIVLEHVSTSEGVNAVMTLGDNVACTITAHHLWLTLNDVIGDGIRPHNGCMPMPKDFSDRDTLRAAATGQIKQLHGRVFWGGDSASHLRENKESAKGACGVFTAPLLPQLLATIFKQEGQVKYLDNFASLDAQKYYGLPVCTDVIELLQEPWTVPLEYGGVVPFLAGQTLPFRLK